MYKCTCISDMESRKIHTGSNAHNRNRANNDLAFTVLVVLVVHERGRVGHAPLRSQIKNLPYSWQGCVAHPAKGPALVIQTSHRAGERRVILSNQRRRNEHDHLPMTQTMMVSRQVVVINNHVNTLPHTEGIHRGCRWVRGGSCGRRMRSRRDTTNRQRTGPLPASCACAKGGAGGGVAAGTTVTRNGSHSSGLNLCSSGIWAARFVQHGREGADNNG